MTDAREPKHCTVCGARLQPSSSIQAYDAFTGEPVAAQRLSCPNVTVGGSRVRPTLTPHPTWDLAGGSWRSE